MIECPATTLVEKLPLQRETAVSWGGICLSACAEDALLRCAEAVLHQKERAVFCTDSLGRWRMGYLRGRLAAKLALGCLHEALDWQDVAIERGVFGQPIVSSRMLANMQVSISHSGGWAAALAFPEAHPMAIDLEVFRANQQEVIRANMRHAELAAMAATGVHETMGLTLLWTIKESLSKVLRTGLMTPFEIYAIDAIRDQGGLLVSTFQNFAQYRCLSFLIADLGVSICLPKRTEVFPDVARWRLFFNQIIADHQCVEAGGEK